MCCAWGWHEHGDSTQPWNSPRGAQIYLSGENIMAFANELITDDARKKYGLDQVDRSMRGRSPQRQWTIDHERDIYLRQIDVGREEASRQSTWHFYWRGELMTVCLEVVEAGSDGIRGGHGWVHYQLVDCSSRVGFIPSPLLDRREEIISDLRAALIAYKGGGVYSTNATYETTLTV